MAEIKRSSYESRQAIETILFMIAERRDAGDFEAVADLFRHSTFQTQYPESAEGHGIQQGRDEILEAYKRTCRVYEDGLPHTKYLTTNTRFDIDDESGCAEVWSYFVLLQALPDFPLQVVSSGRYHDKFSVIDGEWQIVGREIFADLLGDRSHHLAMDPLEFGREFAARSQRAQEST